LASTLVACRIRICSHLLDGKLTRDVEIAEFKDAVAYLRDLYAAGAFIVGRRQMSDHDQIVKEGQNNGGEQVGREYADSIAASA
jgi:hypothetical protein